MKTSFFDKLNLRPQERRLVVIVSLVVFVLLNMWFVWPFFGEWGKVQNDLRKDQATLEMFNAEIAKKALYERKQKDLEHTGSEMLNSETDFQRVISSQAAGAGVYVSDLRVVGGSIGTKTNRFFQEQSISVSFSSGGKEIVDFLVGIAAQNSMIRVREMTVHPDNPSNPTKLTGNIIFVGNYARPQTNAPASRTHNVAAASTQPPKTTNSSVKTPPPKTAATHPTNQNAKVAATDAAKKKK